MRETQGEAVSATELLNDFVHLSAERGGEQLQWRNLFGGVSWRTTMQNKEQRRGSTVPIAGAHEDVSRCITRECVWTSLLAVTPQTLSLPPARVELLETECDTHTHTHPKHLASYRGEPHRKSGPALFAPVSVSHKDSHQPIPAPSAVFWLPQSGRAIETPDHSATVEVSAMHAGVSSCVPQCFPFAIWQDSSHFVGRAAAELQPGQGMAQCFINVCI